MIDITEQAKTDFARRHEKYGPNDFNNEFDFEPLLVLKPEEKDETALIHYEYRANPHHRNVLGTIHGGVVASIFDGGMGQGAAILKRGTLNTVSLSVTYLEGCRGDTYRMEVEYTHLGDRIVDAAAKLYDIDNGNKLCAMAMGSFLVLNQKMPY